MPAASADSSVVRTPRHAGARGGREASWIFLWHGPMGLVVPDVAVLWAVPSSEVPSPEHGHTPWTGCVEHSGDDSACPGG
ncbi:hypothetical protein [Promicromonospora sp. NPDC019610]|uniref:hypothetical protein n=1 Tax=Promicromonospora sp. NPDC019610 TaxID=3364405 RepID=UPI0037AA84CF